MPPCTAILITDVSALENLAKRILAGPMVAVDTESDSLYSYSEKICLVQFSLPDEDYIVDPLTTYSLEPLAEVFASPSVEKVFHGADYDLVSLKRQYGFHFVSIFDTMVAARILGRKNTGLAALAAEVLNMRMDKSMQRSDWGKRPLSKEQLAYACLDTRYLITLRQKLLDDLRARGREQEAREGFADLANLEPKTRIFDADAFWNIKGVRDLDPAGHHIMRGLFRWREEQARSEDRPVFKVINDRALLEIGERKPTSFELVRHSRALSPYQLTRYGHQIVDIVIKAQRETEKLLPPRARSNNHRPDDATLALYERLRSWRKERAALRGVDPDIIASNDLLMTIAGQRPHTLVELAAVPGLGSWRRSEYGNDILGVINGTLQPAERAGG